MKKNNDQDKWTVKAQYDFVKKVHDLHPLYSTALQELVENASEIKATIVTTEELMKDYHVTLSKHNFVLKE